MTILSGTDFSAHAAQAAEVAAALSARTGEPLLLVHAFDGTSGDDAALGRLRAEAGRLSSLFPGLHVETRLEAGIPDEVMIDIARQTQGERAHLIVVSSLGRRAPARWLLGCVADRTAETSPVPVLVVRDAKPFVSWLRGERALRVFVGFDFSEATTPALKWVSELSRVAPCEIVVGHVAWPREERRRSGAHWAMGASSNLPRLETQLRGDVGRRLRVYGWTDMPAIRVKLSHGRRAPSLVELAAEEEGDLLVVGSRQVHGPGRLWQESVSRGVLYHASMSVACVPIPPSASKRAAPEPQRDVDEVRLIRMLEAHPFLRGASGEVLRRLASITREVMFDPGAVLLKEGDDAGTLFLLVSGLVALELSAPEKGTMRLESLRAGDIVGLSWLFPPYRWHLDAKAVEPSLALAIDARPLREWMRGDAAIGQAVATGLARQLYERLERVRMQRLDVYRAEP